MKPNVVYSASRLGTQLNATFCDWSRVWLPHEEPPFVMREDRSPCLWLGMTPEWMLCAEASACSVGVAEDFRFALTAGFLAGREY